MIHTEKKEIDATYLTCDVCGERIDTTYTHFTVCDGCNIHMCLNCRTISPRDAYEDFGDYTTFTCKKCSDLFVEGGFHEDMVDIAERTESLYEEEADTIQSWRDLCKAAKEEKLIAELIEKYPAP